MNEESIRKMFEDHNNPDKSGNLKRIEKLPRLIFYSGKTYDEVARFLDTFGVNKHSNGNCNGCESKEVGIFCLRLESS